MPKNDWDEYKKLVLFEMQENGKRFEKIFAILSELQRDVTGLKVKATIMGGAAGIICGVFIETLLRLWK